MKKFLFLLALVLHGTCSAQWSQILPTTVGTFTYYDMSVIAGANGNDTIFVCGTAGAGKPRLYRSYDGGTTWTSLPFFNYNPHSLSELQRVVAWRSGVVLCSGGNINGAWTYRSTDFGQTWNGFETNVIITSKWGPDDAYADAGNLSNQSGFTKDEGLTYSFFPNTLGQGTGGAPFLTDSIFYLRKNDGGVYKTLNQGANWIQLICGTSVIGLQGRFFSPDTGFWCTGSHIISTQNGGLTWDTVLTISAYRIHFFNRNKGMVCGTQALFSDDGGDTWLTDTAQVPSGSLVAVFRSQNSAYILNSNALFKKEMLTSTDLLLKTKIQIYPNPSSKVIHLNGFIGNETVEVYDFLGKKVFSGKIEKEINHNLNTGNYKIIIKNKQDQIIHSNSIVVQ